MHGIIVVAIVFGSITLWLVLIPVFVFFLKRNRGGLTAKDKTLADEETRIIQEMYQGLSKMEERIEALETLLLEKERKDKS